MCKQTTHPKMIVEETKKTSHFVRVAFSVQASVNSGGGPAPQGKAHPLYSESVLRLKIIRMTKIPGAWLMRT